MALTKAHFRDNPWWSDPTAIESDPHLVRLRERSLVHEHELPFDLHVDAVYTLRGPRQVGKTTFLKCLVEHLLAESDVNPRGVLYADVGGAGVSDHTDLEEFITAFVEQVRSRSPDDRVYILLDEVTGVTDWGVAIRTLHGRGSLHRATVIATGSHALDVKRGGERAPGRRGDVAHWDWLMMPLSFRHFVQLHEPEVGARLPDIDALEPESAFRAAEEAQFVGADLQRLFDRYLVTGGYPHAIAAEHDEGRIPRHAYRLYRDAIRGEVARAGLQERYVRELVSWAGHKRLGQEFSWRDASAETTIGSKETARKYLEAAEGLFVWHVYYRVLDPASPREALRSPKKLYPGDPFGWHVLESWARGEQDPWKASLERTHDPATRGVLVESICADHFRRRFGHFAFYYRDKKGRSEIDFCLFEDGEPRASVEVKYQSRLRAAHRKTLAEQGGGILATHDHLDWDSDSRVATLPVCYLLATIPEDLTLYPERD